MKKFSIRLFSLLAVFCLVFFSFPLVSFAQKNFTIDSTNDAFSISSDVDGIGLIMKRDDGYATAYLFFKTKPTLTYTYKNGSGPQIVQL